MAEFDPAEYSPLPESAARYVQEQITTEHGYLSWLGTEVASVERGEMVLAIPWDEKLTNTDGETIHGGVAATLVDTAGGLVQRTAFENPVAGGVATVNLNVNYLRPANGDLRAIAEVVRSGSSIGVSDVRVESSTNGETREVVVGQGSYRLFRE